MTSRQRVHRCVDLAYPDRPPRDLWLLPLAAIKSGREAVDAFVRRWPTDFTQPNVGRPAPRRVRGEPHLVGQYVDDWGCTFENIQAGVIGEVKNPIVIDWSRLADVQPPTELLELDVAAINDFCRNTDKFVFGGGWARPFERTQFLRGSENVYMDLAEEPPEFFELLRIVHGFYRTQFELWARTDVDALCIMDDWGSQRSLLIAPDQWRRIFKPFYAEYCAIARAGGKKVFMHSDGFIFDIYEDLIQVGVNAINSQLFCMDIEEIGRRFRGRITFWGEIDRQHILPRGTPAEVRAAVKRVVDHLYQPAGGVIAQCELGSGGELENGDVAYRAWDELTSRAQERTPQQ